MKSLTLMLFALVLFTTPLVSALSAAAGKPSLPGFNGSANPIPENISSRTLFFRLTRDQTARTHTSLAFHVSVNGHPFVEETLDVEPVKGENPAFELLAKDPTTLDRLYRLAKSSSNQIAVQVSLNGTLLRELSFQEFLNYNAEIRKTRLNPQVASSEVHIIVPPMTQQKRNGAFTTKGLQADPDCEALCEVQFNDCYYNTCDQRGDCSYCYDNENSCINRCPMTCTEPKSVQTLDSSELVSVSYTGFGQCFESIFQNDFYEGTYYYEVQYLYKTSHIQRTQHCDNTYSDTVLWVTYQSAYCNDPSFGTCYYPTTWVYNACY